MTVWDMLNNPILTTFEESIKYIYEHGGTCMEILCPNCFLKEHPCCEETIDLDALHEIRTNLAKKEMIKEILNDVYEKI